MAHTTRTHTRMAKKEAKTKTTQEQSHNEAHDSKVTGSNPGGASLPVLESPCTKRTAHAPGGTIFNGIPGWFSEAGS